MTDETARRQLQNMLKSFTGGDVLHLFGEVFGEWAEEAREGGSYVIADNLKQAGPTIVLGFGLDALLPKPKMR